MRSSKEDDPISGRVNGSQVLKIPFRNTPGINEGTLDDETA